MLALGLVGVESAHAEAFATLLNSPEKPESWQHRARICHVWGESPAAAKAFGAKHGIPHVHTSAGEMAAAPGLDGVLITTRDGAAHAGQALPFLRRGLATWVDKPLCLDAQTADELWQTALRHGALLAGGSNCKYLPAVRRIRQECAALREKGQLLSLSLNFPGCFDSPHHGLFFYGSHSVEILATLLGWDVRSVSCQKIGPGGAALFNWAGLPVEVNLSDCWDYGLQLYTPQRLIRRKIGLERLHEEGLRAFVAMAEGRRPAPGRDDMAGPVQVLEAMVRSAENGGKPIGLTLP